MKTSIKEKKLARRIVELVLENGEEGEKALPEILAKVLQDKTTSEKRGFLQLLHKTFEREIHRDTLTIESPGPLEDPDLDAIVATWQARHDRPLRVHQVINPELIGGLKIRLGDNLYDASISGKLAALANRVH